MLRMESLTKEDKDSLNLIQEKNEIDINEMNAIEWIRCRDNPLYFILNYVYLPVIGVRKLKYSNELLHLKFRRVIRSIFKYHRCIMIASRQLGKALAIDTPIPLFCGGYTTMEDIKIGDLILDGNGNQTQVIEATDIMYNHECYKIKFDNGDEIIADKDHLWKASNATLKFENKIKTTEELFNFQEKIKNWHHATSSRIQLSDKINYVDNNKKLLIDPYILGLWLGDGTSKGGNISCHEIDYCDYVPLLESRGYQCSKLRYQQGSDCRGTFTVYGLITELKNNNLFGNKHIPDDYLYSSIENRLELLRGLMDSDGYCMDKCGTCQFYQKNINLLIQVRQLLSSLGLKSRYTNRIIKGEKYHQLTFTTNKYYVFNLERKFERQDNFGFMRENRNLYIKNISKIDSVPVRCIQVANEDGMYLCGESMIPTHNSTISACLMTWALIFFPNNPAVILNMRKDAAQGNLKKIRYIIDHLPPFMKIPTSSKSDIKTYLELQNGSRVDTFYPSATHPPETLARSLTVPVNIMPVSRVI